MHWAQREGDRGNPKFKGKSLADLKALEPELKRIIERDTRRAVPLAPLPPASLRFTDGVPGVRESKSANPQAERARKDVA